MSDFKAKMHQIRFPLGFRPDPAGGAYSAPPDPLAVFKGLLLRGGGMGPVRETEVERKWEGRGEGKEGIGKERRGREGREGEWEHAPIGIFESRRL